MNSRLATIDQILAAELASWPAVIGLAIASEVVAWTVERAGLEEKQMCVPDDLTPSAYFDDLAQRLDDLYFDLLEQSNPAHIGYFAKARAATALAFMARGEPGEALYESIVATDLPSVLAFISKACAAKFIHFPARGQGNHQTL
jgi:hypothetical protein